MKLPKDLEASLYKDFADESNYLASLIGAQSVLEHEIIKKLEEALVDARRQENHFTANAIIDNALAEFRAWKDGK